MACEKGRVLAVSFLLGISADPNQVDRWNKTPMDDALRGRVLCVCMCVCVCVCFRDEAFVEAPLVSSVSRVFLFVSTFVPVF